jgi:hypothetical protein
MGVALLAWRVLAQGLPDLLLLAGAVPLGVVTYLASLAILDMPILREVWATWRAMRETARSSRIPVGELDRRLPPSKDRSSAESEPDL